MKIGDQVFRAVLDTGATLSIVARRLCNGSSDSTQIIHQCDQNFNDSQIVMILEIFSFECYFPRDLLSDFEIQMRIRQRRST